MYGFRAYADERLLAYALDVWADVAPWVISAADASSGTSPVKTVQLVPCTRAPAPPCVSRGYR
jgi:hypothetical protein